MRLLPFIAPLMLTGCTSLNNIPFIRRVIPGQNAPMTSEQLAYASFAPWQYGAVGCFIAGIVFMILERKFSFTSASLMVGSVIMAVIAHTIPTYGSKIFIGLCLLGVVAGGYWIVSIKHGKRQIKIAGMTYPKTMDNVA